MIAARMSSERAKETEKTGAQKAFEGAANRLRSMHHLVLPQSGWVGLGVRQGRVSPFRLSGRLPDDRGTAEAGPASSVSAQGQAGDGLLPSAARNLRWPLQRFIFKQAIGNRFPVGPRFAS